MFATSELAAGDSRAAAVFAAWACRACRFASGVTNGTALHRENDRARWQPRARAAQATRKAARSHQGG